MSNNDYSFVNMNINIANAEQLTLAMITLTEQLEPEQLKFVMPVLLEKLADTLESPWLENSRLGGMGEAPMQDAVM